MSKKVVVRIAILAIIFGCFIAPKPSSFTGAVRTTAQEDTDVGKYASINGLELYYEVHGTGDPLILLHGGLATIDMIFAQLIPALAESRQVIAVELQGHGHTADIDRPMTFENMADDTAALITHLGFERADVMGFSLGGMVAVNTAIRHPEQVRKLILVSAVFRRDGWYPEVLQGMSSVTAESAAFMLETPMYAAYAAVAPQPEQWATVAGKVGALLSTPYDFSDQIASLSSPVLIIIGDADSVIPAYAVEMFGLLGGGKTDGAMGGVPASQLAILPNTTHFTITTRTDLLVPIVNPFLNAPLPAAN